MGFHQVKNENCDDNKGYAHPSIWIQICNCCLGYPGLLRYRSGLCGKEKQKTNLRRRCASYCKPVKLRLLTAVGNNRTLRSTLAQVAGPSPLVEVWRRQVM